MGKIEKYAETAIKRAGYMGCETVVFGSGKSRAVPEWLSETEALEQIKKALGIVNTHAEKNNIEIVIEPLNSKETNIINTVKEGYDFVKSAGLSNVKLLADFYHVGQEGDWQLSEKEIFECSDELHHLHIACPITRTNPLIGDGFDYCLVNRIINGIGYSGKMSIEVGSWSKRHETLRDNLEGSMRLIEKLGW